MSRKRWVYTQGGQPLPEPIEVSEDYVAPVDGRMPLFTDRYMEGAHAVDGTDIGSRRKRAEYMKANQLADANDFTNHWAKASEQREEARRGSSRNRAEIREDIARALYRRRKP